MLQSKVSAAAWLLISACSPSTTGSGSSSDLAATQASKLADEAFGEKFCNEIVDPLQQGSMHWMACNDEVSRLVKKKVTQSQLVVQTCDAIKDMLHSSASLKACKEGGKRLIASEAFGSVQKDFFAKTASSLVACYEKVGVIQPSYDETGICAEGQDYSAWTMEAASHMSSALNSFKADGQATEVPGSYQGDVTFYNTSGQKCTFKLDFEYSGEDITARTDAFSCGYSREASE